MYPLHRSLGHAPFSFSFSVVLLRSPPYSILCPLIISRHGPRRKHVSRVIKNARLFVRYLATSCSTGQRKHSSCCCVFAGTRILSRCPAMVYSSQYLHISIRSSLLRTFISATGVLKFIKIRCHVPLNPLHTHTRNPLISTYSLS
jgi:hypothetical protein